jgi:hypothetical protein
MLNTVKRSSREQNCECLIDIRTGCNIVRTALVNPTDRDSVFLAIPLEVVDLLGGGAWTRTTDLRIAVDVDKRRSTT